jgi:hypothetical protein
VFIFTAVVLGLAAICYHKIGTVHGPTQSIGERISPLIASAANIREHLAQADLRQFTVPSFEGNNFWTSPATCFIPR